MHPTVWNPCRSVEGAGGTTCQRRRGTTSTTLLTIIQKSTFLILSLKLTGWLIDQQNTLRPLRCAESTRLLHRTFAAAQNSRSIVRPLRLPCLSLCRRSGGGICTGSAAPDLNEPP